MGFYLSLIWVTSILACVVIAQRKGDSPVAALLVGFVFGPLGILFASLAESKPKCPSCAENVKREAKVCKHCGETLEPLPPAANARPVLIALGLLLLLFLALVLL